MAFLDFRLHLSALFFLKLGRYELNIKLHLQIKTFCVDLHILGKFTSH